MTTSEEFTFSETVGGWRVGQFARLAELPRIVHLVTTLDGPRLQPSAQAAETTSGIMTIGSHLGLGGMAWCEQVHGSSVVAADRSGPTDPADGLITATVGLGLAGRSADCPLVLAAGPMMDCDRAENGWAVGFAHASWRATIAEVTLKMIVRLSRRFAVDTKEIVAGICPSAGPCCYEVKEEVRRQAVTQLGPEADTFFSIRQQKLWFDLWRANGSQLQRAGVRRRNIHIAGICSICHAELFPSYRRQGAAATRFAAVIGIRPVET
jgi:YfiH family protein